MLQSIERKGDKNPNLIELLLNPFRRGKREKNYVQ
jgi:hypothetical protein